jgi:hypothetical protein
VILDRDMLMNRKPKIINVPLPDGNEVLIRSFTPEAGEAWDYFLVEEVQKRKDNPNHKTKGLSAKLFCLSVCDVDGNLLFDIEKDFDTINSTFDDEVVSLVEKAANNLNLLTPAARKEAEKNSDRVENLSSGSSCQVDGDIPSDCSADSSLTKSSSDS